MKTKTIAEHMRDVLIENGCQAVMWGDVRLLDECASRCDHTTLMKAHPLNRHHRIFEALEHSPLFKKSYRRAGWLINGEHNWRLFSLKEFLHDHVSPDR